MKICLINNTYEPYSYGGAETIVKLTAKGFLNNNEDVFIITNRPFFSKQKIIGEKIRGKKIKVYYLKSFFYFFIKSPKPLRLVWHLFNLINPISRARIKKILIKEKPNVVIINNLTGLGYLVPGLIKKLKIRYLHILHDIQLLHPSGLLIKNNEGIINKPGAKVFQFFTKRLVNPEIVISPSAWLINIHSGCGFFSRSKKIMLRNPAVVNLSERVKNKNNIFQFLFVGKLTEEKGVFFLIKAFNNLTKNNNIKLLLIGEGRFLNAGEKIARQNKNIKFLGKRNNEEVKEIMRKSYSLIMPSLCYENSPTVIYEAASMGLPVISCDIGGAGELIKDLGGILFTAGDTDDLLKKINWVIKNPDKLNNIGRRGRDNIRKFSAQNYIKALRELF